MQPYRFGPFLLEVDERRLRRDDGDVVPLTPRLFDALVYFVEHPGVLLDKDTLLEALWSGVIVEENSLSQMVSALRRALGDDAQDSRYIQTVPRRGFRFIATVTRDETPDPPAIEPVVAGAPVEPPESRSRRLWIGGAAAAVAAVAGGAWWWRANTPASGSATTTLAVLPFRPLVATARDEALEIGIADSLVTRLSTLPGVVVRSIGSSRRYVGPDQDPLRAARELDVAWILDGSIQRWGSQVRVTARLLDARNGQAAWSGAFDEAFTGLFDLQDAISTRVALVLAPHLGSHERTRLAGIGGTRNLDAYQVYLAARHQAQGIRTAGLVKSIALFQEAIALDAGFALAYAGLAESYRRMIFGADGEPRIVMENAKRHARRAVDLAPELAEGYSGVGWNAFWSDWDWATAERTFRHAIALNPSEVNAHFGYGQLLVALGREEEALLQMRMARELDPQSLILLTLDSNAVFYGGKHDEGYARLQRVFDLEPDFWVAHLALGSFLLSEGKVDAAIRSMEQADRFADGSSQAAASLGFALARHGREDRARALLQRFADDGKNRYVPPTSSALIRAGLGDRDAVIADLERGYAVRDVRMTIVPYDGRFKLVATDPRFLDLLRRMNLPIS